MTSAAADNPKNARAEATSTLASIDLDPHFPRSYDEFQERLDELVHSDTGQAMALGLTRKGYRQLLGALELLSDQELADKLTSRQREALAALLEDGAVEKRSASVYHLTLNRGQTYRLPDSRYGPSLKGLARYGLVRVHNPFRLDMTSEQWSLSARGARLAAAVSEGTL